MENLSGSRRYRVMMTSFSRIFVLTVVGLSFTMGGAVFAEQELGIPGGAVEMEQQANLSGPDQAAWSNRELEEMRRISGRVQAMLDRARQDQDIIKIGCLNAKLTEVNATIRSFESIMERHQEAVRSRNDDRRNHHFRLMVILAERNRSMRVEAEGCVGGTDVVFGRTEVDVDIDAMITEDDTTAYPIDEYLWDRPTSASGYY